MLQSAKHIIKHNNGHLDEMAVVVLSLMANYFALGGNVKILFSVAAEL